MHCIVLWRTSSVYQLQGFNFQKQTVSFKYEIFGTCPEEEILKAVLKSALKFRI